MQIPVCNNTPLWLYLFVSIKYLLTYLVYGSDMNVEAYPFNTTEGAATTIQSNKQYIIQIFRHLCRCNSRSVVCISKPISRKYICKGFLQI